MGIYLPAIYINILGLLLLLLHPLGSIITRQLLKLQLLLLTLPPSLSHNQFPSYYTLTNYSCASCSSPASAQGEFHEMRHFPKRCYFSPTSSLTCRHICTHLRSTHTRPSAWDVRNLNDSRREKVTTFVAFQLLSLSPLHPPTLWRGL